MSDNEGGVTIAGEFFPFPTSFRLGDPILVYEVTGLSWGEFAERLDENSADPAVLTGLIAVSVWQGNPQRSRKWVTKFVERLDLGEVMSGISGPEAPEDPTTLEGADQPGADSPAPSNLAILESQNSETTQSVSGAPT